MPLCAQANLVINCCMKKKEDDFIWASSNIKRPTSTTRDKLRPEDANFKELPQSISG